MTSAPSCGLSRIRQGFLIETGTLTGGPAGPLTLANDAWAVLDFAPFLQVVSRGTNLTIPNFSYSRAFPRYLEPITGTVPMVFDGNVSWTGVSHEPLTVKEGLGINLEVFRANAVIPAASSPDSTYTLAITRKDGTVVTGLLQTTDFVHNDAKDGIARALWSWILPEGLSP